MNYNEIINPKTGRRVSIYGKTGKKIIKNYVKAYQMGGTDNIVYRDTDSLGPDEAVCVEGKTPTGVPSCRKSPSGKGKRLVGVVPGSQCVISDKGKCRYVRYLENEQLSQGVPMVMRPREGLPRNPTERRSSRSSHATLPYQREAPSHNSTHSNTEHNMVYRDTASLGPDEAVCVEGKTPTGLPSCRKSPSGKGKRLVGVVPGSQCVISDKGKCRYVRYLENEQLSQGVPMVMRPKEGLPRRSNASSHSNHDHLPRADSDDHSNARSMFYDPDADY